jgi:hypothetical protein
MQDQIHIFVATPCYGGMVNQRYMISDIGLLQLGDKLGFKATLDLLGYESLITRGRNILVSRFLDNPTATHLLFIDADIGFDPSQVARMLRFDADVVAGMFRSSCTTGVPACITRSMARRWRPRPCAMSARPVKARKRRVATALLRRPMPGPGSC